MALSSQAPCVTHKERGVKLLRSYPKRVWPFLFGTRNFDMHPSQPSPIYFPPTRFLQQAVSSIPCQSLCAAKVHASSPYTWNLDYHLKVVESVTPEIFLSKCGSSAQFVGTVELRFPLKQSFSLVKCRFALTVKLFAPFN